MGDDYIKALRTIAKERNIPQDELIHLIEDALARAYKRTLLENEQDIAKVRAVVDEKGYTVYCQKQISLYVNNPHLQISIDDAEKIDSNATIGEWVEVEVTPENFGRVAANAFKQGINQKINETEKDKAFEEYESQIGKLVTGHINRIDQLKDGSTRYIVDFGKIEGILAPNEQVYKDKFNVGDLVKFYLLSIKKDDFKNFRYLELSRSHPGFIKRLFELEVPEIKDNIVEIMSIVREAGSRTKISVKSRNENIEPLGSCIGINGSRINAILAQLSDEKIDIIEYSEDPSKYIMNALSPSSPISVDIDEENHHAKVIVPKKQLSLAIGNRGQNVRLAAKLTTWKMDILPD